MIYPNKENTLSINYNIQTINNQKGINFSGVNNKIEGNSATGNIQKEEKEEANVIQKIWNFIKNIFQWKSGE